MDELIKEFAKKIKEANVGDYTYEGILAEFARRVIIEQTSSDKIVI